MVGGRNLVAQCQHADACFQSAGAAEQCPVMDFVELIGTFFARSPKTRFNAIVSSTSPMGVEVPCALT